MKSDPFFYPRITRDEVLDFNFCVNYNLSVPHSAFDNLVIKTSKPDIRSKVKPPFKLTYLVWIIAAHLAIYTAINLSTSGLKRPIPSHKEPLLKATLYFRKPIQVDIPVETIIEKTTITEVKPSNVTKAEPPKIKDLIKEVTKEVPKPINDNIVSNIKNPKTEERGNGQSLINQSLSKLRSSILKQAIERGSKESYNEYFTDKNSVDKSINTFLADPTKIAEIKLKTKYVDCNSGIERNIARLSKLMGGTIKCYSNPSLKDFLKSRNKH